MAEAVVTIKLTPGELLTLDEALRLYVYLGQRLDDTTNLTPFDGYNWCMTGKEFKRRANQAGQIRKEVSLWPVLCSPPT